VHSPAAPHTYAHMHTHMHRSTTHMCTHPRQLVAYAFVFRHSKQLE